jgi:dTDP-4-dehydrorhamnose 3,5-epimerase
MPVNSLTDFLSGPVLLDGPIFQDSRGEFRTIFAESLSQLASQGVPQFSQTNLIRGEYGSLRGFHAGTSHTNHWKAITCVQGEVLEAFLDLRSESQTFGQVRIHNATGLKNETILIPPGFGHGMQSVSPNTISIYTTNVEYSKQDEINVNPMSEEFAKLWTVPPIISDRDKNSQTLSKLASKLK